MAGKFSGILLCSDLDGTLTSDGRTISEIDLEAIRYFESEGGYFTIVSGRFPTYIASVASGTMRDVPPRGVSGDNSSEKHNMLSSGSEKASPCINTFAVALNGSVIADIRKTPTEFVWTRTVDRTVVKRLGDKIDEMPGVDALIIHSAETSVTLKPGYPQNAELVERAVSSPVYKFILMNSTEISGELRDYAEKTFPEVAFERSWKAGLEGRPKDGGKGNAVNALRELLGGRKAIHTVICVGDYENDISMIRYADIGYAVSNAVPEVISAADRVTVSCQENAIADIISKLG